jgi:Amt family ammonium transporter
MLVCGKPSLVGAVNGMITGLVAITPAAGFVNGFGAIVIGIVAAGIPWFTMNKMAIFRRVDDALGVVHTHGFAGLIGGLMVGLVADPSMIVYPGAGKTASFSVGGLFYGHGWHQVLVQLEAAAFVVACSGVGTFAILKLIGLVVPLRMPDAEAEAGDLAIHGEEVGVPSPAPVPQPDLGTALPGSAVLEA